jgi:hypothetical protein
MRSSRRDPGALAGCYARRPDHPGSICAHREALPCCMADCREISPQQATGALHNQNLGCGQRLPMRSDAGRRNHQAGRVLVCYGQFGTIPHCEVCTLNFACQNATNNSDGSGPKGTRPGTRPKSHSQIIPEPKRKSLVAGPARGEGYNGWEISLLSTRPSGRTLPRQSAWTRAQVRALL